MAAEYQDKQNLTLLNWKTPGKSIAYDKWRKKLPPLYKSFVLMAKTDRIVTENYFEGKVPLPQKNCFKMLYTQHHHHESHSVYSNSITAHRFTTGTYGINSIKNQSTKIWNDL